MPKEPTQVDIHKAMFMNLVLMLSTSVMQHLGKMVNPVTQKSEVNLEAAEATIEMIVMLQAKSKGNLDKEEETLLAQTVSTLQMNYVATAQAERSKNPSEGAETDEKKKEPAAKGKSKKTKSKKDESSDDKDEPKQPKFQKSYE
jgi:hypothetical protein